MSIVLHKGQFAIFSQFTLNVTETGMKSHIQVIKQMYSCFFNYLGIFICKTIEDLSTYIALDQ